MVSHFLSSGSLLHSFFLLFILDTFYYTELFIRFLGFLQLIGCLGALRLSEKLLNAYWMLLLVLLIGDAILGVFWMFKFEKIMQGLQPMLR